MRRCLGQLVIHVHKTDNSLLQHTNFLSFQNRLVLYKAYRWFSSEVCALQKYNSGNVFQDKKQSSINLGHQFRNSSLVSKYKMSDGKKFSTKRKDHTDDNSLPEKKQKIVNHNGAEHENFQDKIISSRQNVCKTVSEFKFNKKRVRILSKAKDFSEDCQGVAYWMSRDQRVQGNKYGPLN